MTSPGPKMSEGDLLVARPGRKMEQVWRFGRPKIKTAWYGALDTCRQIEPPASYSTANPKHEILRPKPKLYALSPTTLKQNTSKRDRDPGCSSTPRRPGKDNILHIYPGASFGVWGFGFRALGLGVQKGLPRGLRL